MPSFLHSEQQLRASDAEPTIDRVNALLDRVDVDAIESIWNPETICEASEDLSSLPSEGSTAEAAERVLLDERALADAFSNRYLLPLFDPPSGAPLPIDPAVAERLDVNYCREHKLAPLAEEGQTLEVAIAFPEALQLAGDFQRRSGKQFRPLFAPPSVIERILQLLYPSEVGISPAASQPETEVTEKPPPAEETPQRLIHAMLTAAWKRRATAVHLDRIGEQGEVRFRIDGRLTAWKKISPTQIGEILAGLKTRAKLDAGDATTPQSGSFRIRKGAKRVFVRLDTCPTVEGERSVLHFHNVVNELSGLDQFGFDAPQRSELRGWFSQPPGLILVGSPVGDGTTTTLYSLLRETERPEASIATVESKVERRLQRVHQLQTAEPGGLTFPEGLRALLKQDLDVIMVSELQSPEIVELCLQGCYAGSTVIAGLSAPNPLALFQRMRGWGIDRSQLAAAVRGVVFQRLLRKLCCHCRRPQRLDRSQRQRYGIPLDCTLYQPVGCRHCSGRGYSGRLAVFQLFGRDSGLLRLVASDAPLGRCPTPRFPSLANGFSQAAMRRVVAGETSLAEAVRLRGEL